MMNKQFIYSGLIALLISVITIGAFEYFNDDSKKVQVEYINEVPSKSTLFTYNNEGKIVPLDFQETSKEVINSIVHIKSSRIAKNSFGEMQLRSIPSPFKDFFGDSFREDLLPYKINPQKDQDHLQIGTGSGVIVSNDGYIITNNHVIDQAEDIEVTLFDNRTLKARIIGTDPTTDLALLRIDAKNLSSIPFANSENVNVGQWVLAVGNPMGLNSTVTAGIVSAKGRNINILKEKYAVENFIQTDAAINPGNSGGALVNLQGGLIGINTAIASPTGSFAGYGFAIPANLVAKVMEDFIKFGAVQKGILGITIRTLNASLANEHELDLNTGVYVDSLLEKSAAGKAGVKAGDVIVEINSKKVKSASELQGEIAQFSPGDKVNLKINRRGKEKDISVSLTNSFGEAASMSEEDVEIIKLLGVNIEELSKDRLKELEIDKGLQIKKIQSGKIEQQTQMKEGFILTHVDGKKIKSKEELLNILKDKEEGGVMLEGKYENIPGKFYYAFGLH